MTARSKKPALELPEVFNKAIREYLGPRQLNQLSTDQLLSLSRICAEASGMVAAVIEGDTRFSQLRIGLDGD